jgi:acyl-CoA synthetase (AMP-forming)/AMP-acid ligase II
MGSDLDRSRRLVVPELVARSARRDPEAPALACEGELRSFGELDARASGLAAALAERGVGAGEKVAILTHNRIEFVESFLGVQKLGACAVPVNFRLSWEEVAYVLADSGAVAILTDAELAPTAAEAAVGLAVRFTMVAGEAPVGAESYEEALAAVPPEPPDVVVDDEDLAFLVYTSGTTGRPKGAMLSHQNLVVNTTNWLYEVGARPGDVWLSGLLVEDERHGHDRADAPAPHRHRHHPGVVRGVGDDHRAERFDRLRGEAVPGHPGAPAPHVFGEATPPLQEARARNVPSSSSRM